MEFDCMRPMCEELDEILRLPRVMTRYYWRKSWRWIVDGLAACFRCS
jgi:hypothetical protein